jgi:hypothetical protein
LKSSAKQVLATVLPGKGNEHYDEWGRREYISISRSWSYHKPSNLKSKRLIEVRFPEACGYVAGQTSITGGARVAL